MEDWLHRTPWLVFIWIGLVIVHGLWRSVARPDPDPVRASGPDR